MGKVAVQPLSGVVQHFDMRIVQVFHSAKDFSSQQIILGSRVEGHRQELEGGVQRDALETQRAQTEVGPACKMGLQPCMVELLIQQNKVRGALDRPVIEATLDFVSEVF